jgi:hypothetical protein
MSEPVAFGVNREWPLIIANPIQQTLAPVSAY